MFGLHKREVFFVAGVLIIEYRGVFSIKWSPTGKPVLVKMSSD